MSELSTSAPACQTAQRDHALVITVLTAALALGFGLLLAADQPAADDAPTRSAQPADPAGPAADPASPARLAGEAPTGALPARF
jgi:hypothetical protein